MAEAVRTAGTLAGAILESAGYHYQSYILDALKSPLENEIGGLVYLVGIVVALVYVASQGGMKMGAWLIIGPPIFLAVIQLREPIPNAKWEFALQSRNQARVDEEVSRIIPAESQANVSKLFSRYVQVVSAATRKIVEKISQGRENADLWFVLKAEMFGMMHTAKVDDPGLQEMLHRALYLDCFEIVQAAKAANSPTQRLMTFADSKAVQEAQDYDYPSAKAAEEKYNELYKVKRHNLLSGEALRYAAMQEAEIRGNGQEWQSLQEEMYSWPISCLDIWKWVLHGLMKKSERIRVELEQIAKDNSISEGVMHNLILQAEGLRSDSPIVYAQNANSTLVTTNQAELINRIIAKYFLRNEDGDIAPSALASWMAYRHEWRNVNFKQQRLNSLTEQRRIQIREWSEKERLIQAATALPYYQGLGLYLLGLSFPFFALLLLIPGKIGGFLLWFTLWLWLKSWDIGLAVVMLLDDMIFNLFAIVRQDAQNGQVRAIEPELGAAVAALHEMDPTFQLGTYYSLIALCILSVPIVMAQLVLGSLRSGGSLIAEGSRKYADHFADTFQSEAIRAMQHGGRDDISSMRQNAMRVAMQNQARGRALASGSRIGPSGQIVGMGNSNQDTMANKPGGDEDPYQRWLGGLDRASTGNTGADESTALAHAGIGGGSEGALPPGMGGTAVSGKKHGGLVTGTLANGLLAGRFGHQRAKENLQKLTGSRRELAASTIAWQVDTSQRAAAINWEMALVGGLPLPFTVTAAGGGSTGMEPSDREFDLAMQTFQADIGIQRANWKMMQESTGLLAKAAENAIGRKIKSVQELRALSSPDKLKVLREVTALLGGGGYGAVRGMELKDIHDVNEKTGMYVDWTADSWSRILWTDQRRMGTDTPDSPARRDAEGRTSMRFN